MQFTDQMTFDGSLRRTQDGYAVIEARVARAGNVQVYRGDEMGMPDRQTIRVYRPEAEVFKRDAIASYAGVPVTMGHPAEKVTADSWKSLSVGEAGEDVLRDGDFVRVPLMLRDSSAISAVENGRRELSMGYEADLTFQDGTSPTGEEYDAVMSNFRMNHVAIVDHARGGKELRIGDGTNNWGARPVIQPADERNSQMSDTLQTVVVDGLNVSTTDQGAQAITKLTKDRDDARKALTDAEASHKTALEAKDAELAKKDAEMDDLNKKVIDGAALDKLVADRAALVGTARAIAKDVKTDGLSDAEIRKAVVKAKLGDEAIANKSDAYIDARFDILAEDAEGGDDDPVRKIVSQGVKPNDAAINDEAKAYEASIASLNPVQEAS